jgi:catechol 2,3-dioxygenase-like lactoylglutathione lyase family enzyme
MSTPLAGQQTLRACWRAFARLSSVARLVGSASTVAAVFRSWAGGRGVLRTARRRAAADGMPASPRWLAWRVARPARDLDRSVAFYRDLLGLREQGGFRDHDGYDGAFFALPGEGQLELTSGPAEPRAGTEEDLLVLYLGTADEVSAVAVALRSAGVAAVTSPNPYWNRLGHTFLDPDGHRIVIAAMEPGTVD